MSDLAKTVKDDLKFAESVDKAWSEHTKGKFKTLNKEAFLEELDKW